MENDKSLYQLFAFFQGMIYLSIALEILLYLFYDFSVFIPLLPIFEKFWQFKIYQDHNIFYSKFFTLTLLFITTIGSRPKKKLDVNVLWHIVLPVFFGLLVFFGASLFYFIETNTIKDDISILEISYVVGSLFGAIMLHIGLDNISKIIKFKLGDDVFNDENESFKQSVNKVENQYSVNLPMKFYHKGKTKKGWFNLTNVFRGTLVIGVPESGKSLSIIIPFIQQTIRKGFAQLIYDYKYPDLTQMAYYHFLLEKKRKPNNFKFHVVNLSKIEYSRRVNPLDPKYLKTLAHCLETAEALVYALQKKSDGSSGGAEQFFTLSFINFLAATFYFFSKHQGGRYSTLPHILFFLNKEYEEIFDVLTTEEELDSLLSPFLSAYRKKAYDQLEGQLGTLRVNLGKMNTKESAWVFSGNDVDLRISHPDSPSILVIGNDKSTQSSNAAINSLLLNRLVGLVNQKGNIPVTLSVDELPTIFFYQIQQLIATARSNKVAVLLGLQELPQLVERYGKTVADSVTSVIGNTISGAVRDTRTLQWLERLFGKSKQLKKGVSINRREVSTSINEQMDNLIPSSKIADLKTGQIVAKLAPGFQKEILANQNPNTYRCTIELDFEQITKEEAHYPKLPKYYNFKSEVHQEQKLKENYLKIKDEVDYLVDQFYK